MSVLRQARAAGLSRAIDVALRSLHTLTSSPYPVHPNLPPSCLLSSCGSTRR